MNVNTFYPEDLGTGLRSGQLEINWIVSESGGQHLLIKTYQQTHEEAGLKKGSDRKAFLMSMEGDSYFHNGIEGIYRNVGSCNEDMPREYAIRTLLIKNQSEFLDAKGDWDYEVLVQKNMHDNLELITDMDGNKVNFKDMRKGYSPDHMTYVFNEIDEVTITQEGVTRVRCKRTDADRPWPRKLEEFSMQSTITGRVKSDEPNISNLPKSFPED